MAGTNKKFKFSDLEKQHPSGILSCQALERS